mmetsp:Transcript_94582/g.304305  ORF Transcript_94582/g.304305 Transcript_94582/m.304305 type:complete len:437 (-) Transcript_94582:611-1921(-)
MNKTEALLHDSPSITSMSPNSCGTVVRSVKMSPASASSTTPAPLQKSMSPSWFSLSTIKSMSNCWTVRKVTAQREGSTAAKAPSTLLFLAFFFRRRFNFRPARLGVGSLFRRSIGILRVLLLALLLNTFHLRAFSETSPRPRPRVTDRVEAPCTASRPMPQHLDLAHAHIALHVAFWEHPADGEVLLVRNLLQGGLEGMQIIAWSPVELQYDRVGRHGLTEHEACVRDIDALQGNVVLLRSLVRNVVEDSEGQINEVVRDQVVLVLDRQLNLHTLAATAHSQIHLLANRGVQLGIPKHEVHARLTIQLQQHVAHLQGLRGRGALHAAPDLKHATRRCGLAERSALRQLPPKHRLGDEALGDAQAKHLREGRIGELCAEGSTRHARLPSSHGLQDACDTVQRQVESVHRAVHGGGVEGDGPALAVQHRRAAGAPARA